MRLGREQASGYVEDIAANQITAADEITVRELTGGSEELTTATPAAEPAIPVA